MAMVRCNNCMKIFHENEIIYEGDDDMEFCPHCHEGGCIMDITTNERLEAFYKELDALLNYAPCEDDCTDEENKMYSDMANLKESMFDAGYGR